MLFYTLFFNKKAGQRADREKLFNVSGDSDYIRSVIFSPHETNRRRYFSLMYCFLGNFSKKFLLHSPPRRSPSEASSVMPRPLWQRKGDGVQQVVTNTRYTMPIRSPQLPHNDKTQGNHLEKTPPKAKRLLLIFYRLYFCFL